MKQFIESMLGEGGNISHKRFISVIAAIASVVVFMWASYKYEDKILDMYHSTLIFIAVMSGVATVAQIVSLVNRTPAPSASADTNTETKTS